MSTLATFDTPVLYLIFNRPAHTGRSFAAIRERRPARLFIAADGPRAHVPTDVARVAQCRTIVSAVDWPCEVHTLYREQNLGCGAAVAQAITWFFGQVDRGIILEDDCVPGPDFWPFCATLLEHYADDPRVMCISGDNFLPAWLPVRGAYYFSRYPCIWGWATWARAWAHYALTPPSPSGAQVAATLNSVGLRNPLSRWWWKRTLTRHVGLASSSWGYRWTYAIWAAKGLSATPHRNLVSNIGVDGDATHTAATMHLPNASSLDPARSLNVLHSPHRNRLADAVYDLQTITGRNLIAHGMGKLWNTLPRVRRSL